MIRTAIIENGIVTNVVMHDSGSDWVAPEGAALVASETASLGDCWDGSQFTAQPPSPEQINAGIRARLAETDARSVRSLRAILEAQAAGTAPEAADVAMLAELNAQAALLRAALVT
ncbi:conserved protein of unknown function [Magnetospirillum sp. XM-1]|uniref:hypothetical protein n=1 Tax=Magnetospirillum sp. XM-1 TaxID=1663591 RepID=UPI00073DCF34|nr:hypothetical protein [Magnetospirillum sp. XM-1]CUW37699.1 conserved protein of unknown function [Magnetospirillum sp. XM-1]